MTLEGQARETRPVENNSDKFNRNVTSILQFKKKLKNCKWLFENGPLPYCVFVTWTRRKFCRESISVVQSIWIEIIDALSLTSAVRRCVVDGGGSSRQAAWGKCKPCCVRVGCLCLMLPGQSVVISHRCVCVTDVGNVDKWCSRSCRRPCTSLSINHRRRLCSSSSISSSSDSFFLSRRLTRRRTLRGEADGGLCVGCDVTHPTHKPPSAFPRINALLISTA